MFIIELHMLKIIFCEIRDILTRSFKHKKKKIQFNSLKVQTNFTDKYSVKFDDLCKAANSIQKNSDIYLQ